VEQRPEEKRRQDKHGIRRGKNNWGIARPPPPPKTHPPTPHPKGVKRHITFLMTYPHSKNFYSGPEITKGRKKESGTRRIVDPKEQNGEDNP